MAFYKHSRHCELHPLERWQRSLEIQHSTNTSSLTEKIGKFLVIFINLSPIYQTWYLEIHPYFNTDLIACPKRLTVIHTFIHWWRGLLCKVQTSTSEAVWDQIKPCVCTKLYCSDLESMSHLALHCHPHELRDHSHRSLIRWWFSPVCQMDYSVYCIMDVCYYSRSVFYGKDWDCPHIVGETVPMVPKEKLRKTPNS